MRQIIEARVHTGSSRRRIELVEDTFHIYTHAKPVQGKANADAIALIADYFGVAKSAVMIKRGEKSKSKVFEINGYT